MARGNRKDRFYTEPMNGSVKEEVEETIIETFPAEEETTGPETKNGTVINSLHVKVRRDPSFESDVVEYLRKGDTVIIHGMENGFYRVSTKRIPLAYIYSEFIKEE